MRSTLFRFGISPFFYLLQYASCKDLSVLERSGTWYQPRHVLVYSWVVRCYSLFVCHSEAEWAFYFHVHFQVLGLLRLVNIVMLLLRVSCYPSSSYDHQSLFVVPPFLAATVLLSTERSSIFINPEVYPRDTRDFIIFFHTPLTHYFLCRSQTVL